MIYFDNAATTLPKPKVVLDRLNEAMEKAGNPGRGAHTAAFWSAKVIYDARCMVAKLIGASNPMDIAFTSNATEALNFAIHMVPDAGEIVTTSMEHNSVLRPCYERKNIIIVLADNQGLINADDIINSIGENTKAVIMTHASNVTGTIYDIEAVGKVCREKDILFIVDASQTCGVVPIDVDKMYIDVLCFTGHKALFGPQGTGGIYVSPRVKHLLRPFKTGGSGSDSFHLEHPRMMPDVMEAGTVNTPGIHALSGGIEFVLGIGVEEIFKHDTNLANVCYSSLKQMNNVKVYGDFSFPHVGIVSFNIENMDSNEVCGELNRFGICARGGLHCAPIAHECLGTVNQGVVRFSFSYFNTIDEVFKALEVVENLANSSGK